MKHAPYPSYKPSGVNWLGDVPEHWRVTQLRRTFDIANGGTPASSEERYWDGETDWLTPDDLGRNRGMWISGGRRKITRDGVQNSSAQVSPKGSIVLSTRAPIGHLAIAAVPAATNQGCRTLVPATPVNNCFAYYSLLASRSVLQSLGKGSTFMELTPTDLGSHPISLPPQSEQRAIAAFLERETDKVDALIAKKQWLIDRLAEYRTALITRTVTKGLPPDVATEEGFDPSPRLKPSGVEWLGEVPAHWHTARISALARPGFNSFTDGDWVELPYITESGIRLIQTGNIGIGTYREQGFRYIDESSFAELRCTEVDPGDVLICRLADPVGRACRAPDLGVRMITSVDVCILKPYEECSPAYLTYLLSSKRYLSYVESLVRGGTRDRISRSMLGAIKIPKPPRGEQDAIAAFLDKQVGHINTLSVRVEAAIERLRELRTALITAAVTGKIDVRDRVSVEAEDGTV